MAVVIRLNRVGAKHRPKYRITVADQRRWLGGSSITSSLGAGNRAPGM